VGAEIQVQSRQPHVIAGVDDRPHLVVRVDGGSHPEQEPRAAHAAGQHGDLHRTSIVMEPG
jgi:hypothetical protein